MSALAAEEGLSKAAAARPDLILLDYNLPDFHGIAFLERLAEAGLVPLISMTG